MSNGRDGMIQRRKFLWLALFGFLLVAGIAWYYRLKKGMIWKKSWEPLSLSEICTRQKMIDLGLAYRKITGENTLDSLRGLLSLEHDGPFTNRQKQLEERISEDFKQDHTIMIDGWLLSITEARQCALLSFEDTD